MRIWNLFSCNRLFKHNEVVSILHVCSNGLGKMCDSYTFHFSTRILTLTHAKWINIFSHNICPTINFQLSIMSKWLCKTISTKVCFEITIRKRHAYIDIVWPWIWNQCFYLGIWNDYRTNMIILPSFQLDTRQSSQNTNELRLLMNSDTLIFLWILVNPFGLKEVSTSRKCCFWLYFSSLHDYWPESL